MVLSALTWYTAIMTALTASLAGMPGATRDVPPSKLILLAWSAMVSTDFALR